MGVAAAGKKNFRQRDDGDIRSARCGQFADLTGSGRQNPRASIHLFQADGSGPGKHKLMVGTPEGIISGILGESAAVIRLRANVTRRGETIEREILSLGALQRVIPLVVNESEARASNDCGQGKQIKLSWGKIGSKIAGFDTPVIEPISNRVRVIRLLLAYLLPQIDLSFQP